MKLDFIEDLMKICFLRLTFDCVYHLTILVSGISKSFTTTWNMIAMNKSLRPARDMGEIYLLVSFRILPGYQKTYEFTLKWIASIISI